MGRQGQREGRVQLDPEQAPDRRLGELVDERDVASAEEWDHAAVVEPDGKARRIGQPPFWP